MGENLGCSILGCGTPCAHTCVLSQFFWYSYFLQALDKTSPCARRFSLVWFPICSQIWTFYHHSSHVGFVLLHQTLPTCQTFYLSPSSYYSSVLRLSVSHCWSGRTPSLMFPTFPTPFYLQLPYIHSEFYYQHSVLSAHIYTLLPLLLPQRLLTFPVYSVDSVKA